MRVIFSSGTMIDSRDVTWASIPPLALVLCEQGGQEPTELQEMESVEGETNASNGESDDLQFDRQKSAGDEEDGDDEDSIFLLVVDPAPTRAAAPLGRAAQLMSLTTTDDFPTEKRHWRAVRKTILYLNGTNELGLMFSKRGWFKALSIYWHRLR